MISVRSRSAFDSRGGRRAKYKNVCGRRSEERDPWEASVFSVFPPPKLVLNLFGMNPLFSLQLCQHILLASTKAFALHPKWCTERLFEFRGYVTLILAGLPDRVQPCSRKFDISSTDSIDNSICIKVLLR